jgi:hypothetical protein
MNFSSFIKEKTTITGLATLLGTASAYLQGSVNLHDAITGAVVAGVLIILPEEKAVTSEDVGALVTVALDAARGSNLAGSLFEGAESGSDPHDDHVRAQTDLVKAQTALTQAQAAHQEAHTLSTFGPPAPIVGPLGVSQSAAATDPKPAV